VRPRLLVLPIVVAALAGCGSDSSPPETADSGRAAAGAFPAKVEHKYGTTTVPSRPKRIVSVGFTEHDTVLALGEKPIATSEWYGDQPHAIWPWARDELGSSKPTVLDNADGFEYERIAALRPDLILGMNAGMSREDYEKLSKLAPTVPAAKGSIDWFSDWDTQVELIAAALGKPDEGMALIERVEDGYAKAAAEHPEFKGKTATFVQNGFYDGLIYAYQERCSASRSTRSSRRSSRTAVSRSASPRSVWTCSTPTPSCSPRRSRRTSRR